MQLSPAQLLSLGGMRVAVVVVGILIGVTITGPA